MVVNRILTEIEGEGVHDNDPRSTFRRTFTRIWSLSTHIWKQYQTNH